MRDIPPVVKQLYTKNCNFFKSKHAGLYQIITEVEAKESNVTISNDGKVDLIYKERSIYANDAITFAENEVSEFRQIYENKTAYRVVTATVPDLYSVKRHFQRNINKAIHKIYDECKKISPTQNKYDNQFDLIVVTGIGLGLHLSELIETVDVQNLIIYENNYEHFKLSCYFTDWEELHKKQDNSLGKSLTFVMTNNMEHDNSYASLWNELIKHPPHFPFNTVFYNHGRSSTYGDIIRKLENDQRMFLSLWGHYDDEVNQVNHILHNLHSNMKWIPHKKDFKWGKPVVICGSGPSLDDRWEQLKSMQDDAIILCAGTALRPLLKNNIIPDYHIEIESDYIVSDIFDWLDNIDKLKEIVLLCGIQSNPKIFNYFKDTYVYAKDSLATGDMIDLPENKIIDPTPTCTNAAIALALHYEANDIYLFGTDFGFYSEDKHHSATSEYHIDNDKNQTTFKDEAETIIQNNFEQDGYLGKCLTTNMYYSAKRRVEMAIRFSSLKYTPNVYNCCDGLIIDKTIHINKNEKITLKKSDSSLIKITDPHRLMDPNLPEHIIKELLKCENHLCSVILESLEQLELNIKSLSTFCWSISDYIDKGFRRRFGNLQYFFRGTIWHYMLAGYSLAHSCHIESDTEKVISIWRQEFKGFLTHLEEHTRSTLSDYKDRSSVRLNTSILDELPDNLD